MQQHRRSSAASTGAAAHRSGPYVGRPMPRFEDLRLVRGAGRFTDDFFMPGQAHAAFVRSPHAHARIAAIDAEAARNSAGVLAVLTGADYLADGHVGIPQLPAPADVVDYTKPAFAAKPGRPILDEPHLPLAVDCVRYVGEAVAVVVAETAAAARDAAEQIAVAYEELPAVTDVLEAIAPGAPAIWSNAPDNIAVEGAFGDREATLAAFARADIVIEQAFRNQRVAIAQLEPRAALGVYDAATGGYTLISGSQGAHRQRQSLAACLDVPPAKMRVICPDVGGGFGARTNVHPEQAVVAWAARKIGRPVKWTSDRSEAFLADYQGRDVVATARLALNRDGRVQALDLALLGNIGAHTITYVPLNNGPRVATSVYAIPAAYVRIRGVMTNTAPTAPYRGAGRPETLLVIERLLDIAANRLGIDRAEIRRRNLIARAQLPYKSAMGLTYDSGDFAGNFERTLDAAEWTSFPARRREAEKRGRLRGIGAACYVEAPVGAPHERVEVKVSGGMVELNVGTQSTGQGHETTFAQVMADQLGVHPEEIKFMSGDTEAIVSGGGSHSDRSMRIAGSLMVEASQRVIAQATQVTAALLDVKPDDIIFADGLFHTPKRNERLSIHDVARAIAENPALPADLRRPLAAEAVFTGRLPAYPTGVAVCEVEIDPATGAVELCRYSSVDDAGRPVNPLILHGQMHGGIAQGVGQALTEAVMYAPDTGQPLTGSFLDYAIPRADLLPSFEVELAEDPTAGNVLRVKGGGEGGITPCLAVVMNAVADALSPLGIEHLDMPATPYRVWRAIQQARRKD